MKFEKALKEGFTQSVGSLSPEEKEYLRGSVMGKVSGQPNDEVINIELRGIDDAKLSKNFGRDKDTKYGDKLIISFANKGGINIPGVAGKIFDFSNHGQFIQKQAQVIANIISKNNMDLATKLTGAVSKISANMLKYTPNSKPYDIVYNPTTKVMTINPDIR